MTIPRPLVAETAKYRIGPFVAIRIDQFMHFVCRYLSALMKHI